MATAITANPSMSTPQFANLAALLGSGESTMFVDDVTGILVNIEIRNGFYEVTDQKTGAKIQRPNSWIAHWSTPTGEKLMSWPTYQDKATGQVMPWSRFDPSINLQQCSASGVQLHMWKDDRNFYHLEVAEMQVNLNPMPIAAPQVVAAAPAVAPWVQQ